MVDHASEETPSTRPDTGRPSLPSYDEIVGLPAPFPEETVTEEHVDVNGHMNIGDYFRFGTYAPWLELQRLGVTEDYITDRGMSFFTVEHHIRYLAELRLGQRFSVHAGFAGRTDKALHALAAVVDREHERVACLLELMFVHVSMASRRAAPIPEEIGTALDESIAAHPWVAAKATALTLRR